METCTNLNEFRQFVIRNVSTINDNAIIDTLKIDGIVPNALQVLFQFSKPVQYSLRHVLAHCRTRPQAEILLHNKNYVIRRSDNKFLWECGNMEILEFLLTNPLKRMNPGYKSSLPLLKAIQQSDVERIRLYLATRMCDIHAKPNLERDQTILQIAMAIHNPHVMELLSIEFDGSNIQNYTEEELLLYQTVFTKIRHKRCSDQEHAKMELLTQVESLKKNSSKTMITRIVMGNTSLVNRASNHILAKSDKVKYIEDLVHRYYSR